METQTFTPAQLTSKTFATLAAGIAIDVLNPAKLPNLAREIMQSEALPAILEKTKPDFLGFTLSIISTVANSQDGLSLSAKQIAAFQRTVNYNLQLIVAVFMKETLARNVAEKTNEDATTEA